MLARDKLKTSGVDILKSGLLRGGGWGSLVSLSDKKTKQNKIKQQQQSKVQTLYPLEAYNRLVLMIKSSVPLVYSF